MPIERRFITIAEAAVYLSISAKTCYKMAQRGELPSVKIGRLRRIDLKALAEKLAKQKVILD